MARDRDQRAGLNPRRHGQAGGAAELIDHQDAITHDGVAACLLSINLSIFPHKRSRSDEVPKALRQGGGVIGCAAYRHITPERACADLVAFCAMIARMVEIAGSQAGVRACRWRA